MKKYLLVVMGFVAIFIILSILFVGNKSNSKLSYVNSSENNIVVNTPLPGERVGKKFTVTGFARGSWFFEASFPVILNDIKGVPLSRLPASAKGEWMTENFVPFEAVVEVPETFSGEAVLTLRKDNPSDIRANDASVSFPLVVQ